MVSDSTNSLAVSAEPVNEKSTLTMPVNVPLKAGDEIRTRDVQLGNQVWRSSRKAKKVLYLKENTKKATASQVTAKGRILQGS
jgi:hypothetical protein